MWFYRCRSVQETRRFRLAVLEARYDRRPFVRRNASSSHAHRWQDRSEADPASLNSAEVYIHRLPWMQAGSDVGRKDRFNHEHQFATARLAIDHRWRVFGLRRNVAHGAAERPRD